MSKFAITRVFEVVASQSISSHMKQGLPLLSAFVAKSAIISQCGFDVGHV